MWMVNETYFGNDDGGNEQGGGRGQMRGGDVLVWDEPGKVFGDAEEELERAVEAERTGFDREFLSS